MYITITAKRVFRNLFNSQARAYKQTKLKENHKYLFG